MKLQSQLHRGNSEVQGDCYRTCLAMVLDMDRDEVPHFCEHVPAGSQTGHPEYDAADRWEHEWLAERGLARVVIPHPGDTDVWELVEHYGNHAPHTAVILQTSLYGQADHAVVLYRGRLYDPLFGESDHVQGTFRYQPSTHGFFWVTILARATNTLTHTETPATVVSEENV